MTPDELKEYFENNPPPLELQWKPWAKMTDSKRFIEGCLIGIGAFKGHYNHCPDYWHLKEFYEDMISGNINQPVSD